MSHGIVLRVDAHAHNNNNWGGGREKGLGWGLAGTAPEETPNWGHIHLDPTLSANDFFAFAIGSL